MPRLLVDCWRWRVFAAVAIIVAVLGFGCAAVADEQDAPWATGWGIQRTAKSSGFTAGEVDRGVVFDCTGTFTIALTPAATLRSGWHIQVFNSGNGTVTIDPNGTEKIEFSGGVDTVIQLQPHTGVVIECAAVSGTEFIAVSTGGFAKGFSNFRSVIAADALRESDSGRVVVCTLGPYTVTLPPVGTNITGWNALFYNPTAGTTVTIAGTAGTPIIVNGSAAASVALPAGSSLMIVATLVGSSYYAVPCTGSTGAAGGDLSGTYPNPTVAKINGVSLGTMGATAGKIVAGDGTNISSLTMSGDATIGGGGALALKNTGTSGTYASVTTDAQGRVTAGANLSGDVTTSGSAVTTLKNTGTAGTYASVTTDAQGRVTAGANLSGDVTTSGGAVTTLANTAVVAGSYTSANITVDAKGRLTSAANGTGGSPDLSAIAVNVGTNPATNTAVATSLLGSPSYGSLTVPANFFTAGRALRLTLQASIGSAATPSGIVFSSVFGSTQSTASSPLTAVPALTSMTETVTYICTATGVSGTMCVQVSSVIGGFTIKDKANTYTFDTTASHALDFQVTWTPADPSNSVTGGLYTLQPLN